MRLARVDRDQEFSDYVAARWPRLVRAAILLGCTPAEAEDVAQTALTRCLLSWSRVRRAADRDAYVHRVLMNTFTDHRRRATNREIPTDRVVDLAVPDSSGGAAVRAVVASSLTRLTTEQRSAVVLRYYLDLSEQQMAVVLGVAPGTVKSRLARGLAALAADPALDPSLEHEES